MLKVIEIYNIGYTTQNIFLKICKILFRMMLNKMCRVSHNLFIIRIYRKC